jgi:NADPH-dependent 2,4-dienoyl-CoA reductase/sulfur reductase-like enzyme/rhodanese-related sulfurtransferase
MEADMRVCIVGGVAGGASAAARLRRLTEDAEIVIFERGNFVSFANCGLPYHMGGDIPDRQSLLVTTPEELEAKFNILVNTCSEVTAIDTAGKTLEVTSRITGKKRTEHWDKLILSPGAMPIRPPIPGVDSERVMTLRDIPDMDRIMRQLQQRSSQRIAVIGGGFIGVEVAEAMVHRGFQTSLIEASPQIMAPLDPEMAAPLHCCMRQHGVDLRLNTQLQMIDDMGHGLRLELSDGTEMDVDLVVMAIGVRPETSLARTAGLDIGELGGIRVNEYLQTSHPDIYAVGDAIEVHNLVTGKPALVPMAGPANRQGRIAAANIMGRKQKTPDIQGTGICKVFELAMAATGTNEKWLRAAGVPFDKVYIHANHHAGYYPGATQVSLKVLFDPKNGRVLGAQATGENGVERRIDILAMAIRAGLTVHDIEDAELCYSPPYGSAKDVVNFAGFVAVNVMEGDMVQIHGDEMDDLLEDTFILDVRNPDELSLHDRIPGSYNIPLPRLRKRMDEVPGDRPVVVYCQVGLRGYVAARALGLKGYQVRNLAGGYRTWRAFHPDC